MRLNNARQITGDALDDALAAVGCCPDTLTPSQFFDERRPADPYHAERKLWIKAFETALDDCRYIPKGGHGHPQGRSRERARLDALEWLKSDDTGLLSFRWYCLMLGFDAGAVRQKLLSLTQNAAIMRQCNVSNVKQPSLLSVRNVERNIVPTSVKLLARKSNGGNRTNARKFVSQAERSERLGN
jgi:hypothetical protein